MTEEGWLLLLLLMAQMSGGPEDRVEQARNLIDQFQEEMHEKDVRDHCEYIIWEQDMGSHVPFCMLTGTYCDLHCMKGE